MNLVELTLVVFFRISRTLRARPLSCPEFRKVNRVNLNKVIMRWPDMLRVAGSVVTNQVRAYDLLRMFGREGRPAPLGHAFAEYGRVAKTEHLLRVVVVDPIGDTCPLR